MADEATRKKFGEALRHRLSDLGKSQRWLGTELATVAAGERVSQAAVNGWLQGSSEPPPARVFQIEEALDVVPGSLSSLLGYVPADAVDRRSVPEAIDSDRDLTEQGRRMLHAAYEAAREG